MHMRSCAFSGLQNRATTAHAHMCMLRPTKRSKFPVIGSVEAPWGPIDRKAREVRG